MTKMNEEVMPPWIKFPGYAPGDFFWREAGEFWLNNIWGSFWKKLSSDQQNEYLEKHQVPSEWRRFYFDADFNNWLDQVDDE